MIDLDVLSGFVLQRQQLYHRVPVIGMNDLPPEIGVLDPLIGGIAQQRQDLGADVKRPRLFDRVVVCDRGKLFHECPVPGLRFAKLLLHACALGDFFVRRRIEPRILHGD